MAGVESAVRLHIARGDDLNARDDNGLTPLMLSAARNKPAICKLLIEAGVELGLLDPAGRDALGIAQAARAVEAALVIERARLTEALSNGANSSCDLGLSSLNGPVTEASGVLPAIQLVANAPPAPAEKSDFDQEIENGSDPSPLVEWTSDVAADSGAFDLTGWEAEKDLPPPEDDSALAVAALQIQSVIAEHQPIDTSADWGNFEVFLPERASPLPRADDTEEEIRQSEITVADVAARLAATHDYRNSLRGDVSTGMAESRAIVRRQIQIELERVMHFC